MSHLLREHAPVSELNWSQIDGEAKERLVPDWPRAGWSTSSDRSGGSTPPPTSGASTRSRLRPPTATPGSSRAPGRAAARRAARRLQRQPLGAARRRPRGQDVDFDDLDAAAEVIATAENIAVFHGWQEAGIAGITAATPHTTVKAGKAIDDYPIKVAQAVELLLRSGVGGPYGIALGREEYTQVIQTTEHGGYLLAEHLKRILGGPLVWAPGVKGAVVVSLRGGDFLFESGQDISVGYASHDAEVVNLYLEESFSFRVATPEAAVAIA